MMPDLPFRAPPSVSAPRAAATLSFSAFGMEKAFDRFLRDLETSSYGRS